MHTIVLFYKYVPIENPQLEMARQRAVLEILGIKGRFIIAEEGINGTGEGTTEAIQKYVEWMKSQRMYKHVHWKLSPGTGDCFPKLSVKVRKEIVSLHLGEEGDVNPNVLTGTHLPPHELDKWYKEGKDFYIVDMRNDYELESGKFDGTIFPGLKNFRDLREKIDELADLKDKTVLTVCTGGVRCEKASGFLKKEGFKDVYQLDGGIVSYMTQFPGQNFKGSLYVFDKRKTMHFDSPENHTVIGKCYQCGTSSEIYRDCVNTSCHRHYIACDECSGTDENLICCSAECRNAVEQKLAKA